MARHYCHFPDICIHLLNFKATQVSLTFQEQSVPHVLAAFAYLCVVAQTSPSMFSILDARQIRRGSKSNVVDHIGDTAGTLVTWVHIARRWGSDTYPARHSGDRSGN